MLALWVSRLSFTHLVIEFDLMNVKLLLSEITGKLAQYASNLSYISA